MTPDEIILAQQEYLFPAVFHYFDTPLVVTRAKNQFVYDAQGNEYLDFFGGIVTISVGHSNDEVTARVRAQMDRLQHVSTVFANEPQVALAKRVADQFDELKDKYPVIGDVRGMGLIQALELVEDRQSKAPAAALTSRVLQAARDERLLIGKGGTFGNCLRVTPPLNITWADVDEFALRLNASFSRTVPDVR